MVSAVLMLTACPHGRQPVAQLSAGQVLSMMRAPLRRVSLAPGQRSTAVAKVARASNRSFILPVRILLMAGTLPPCEPRKKICRKLPQKFMGYVKRRFPDCDVVVKHLPGGKVTVAACAGGGPAWPTSSVNYSCSRASPRSSRASWSRPRLC
jgi:hypothetical protein